MLIMYDHNLWYLTMSLNKLMVSPPQSFTYTKDYKEFLETLMYFFRTSPNAPILPLTPDVRHVYRFDLEGFLLINNVPLSEHYLVMRINEFENLHNLDVAVDAIILPDLDLLRNVQSIYKSKMKK